MDASIVVVRRATSFVSTFVRSFKTVAKRRNTVSGEGIFSCDVSAIKSPCRLSVVLNRALPFARAVYRNSLKRLACHGSIAIEYQASAAAMILTFAL